MAIGGYIRIYRKASPSDTFASLGTTEKIELNVNGTDNKVANMWSTHWHRGSPRALAEHPNPNEQLGEQQDTGLDEKVYEIDFAISRADLVTNQFLINLELWNEEDGGQESLTMPFGRFSIELEEAPGLQLISDATKGLEMRSIDYDKDEETQNLLRGTLILSQGKQAS